ncbi:uncharacterized protein LOC106161149 [Lingula anatina]|uniref:Uncharacterized protein LOC106161149 n=1 Tax=Lingula anatina TaxID=7574 RepID=A0A1S3I5C1_LINAN|nr:uncharacterized protein LOC106161149 [Lingula anatina]|eukprot:XP_013393470.1 uncharacterized protein LOC106161149 [Lingula anatina]
MADWGTVNQAMTIEDETTGDSRTKPTENKGDKPQSGVGATPAQSTTSVPAQGNEGTQQRELKPLFSFEFNDEYLFFPPGILKIIQLVFGIICIGCSGMAMGGGAQAFLSVAIIVFFEGLLTFIIIVSRKDRIMEYIFKFDIIFSIVASLAYLVVSCLLAATSGGWPAYIAAVVFGFLNTLALGSSIVFLIMFCLPGPK